VITLQASSYTYDTHDEEHVSLRGHTGAVADHLKREIQDRLSKAGAIIAARSRIVEGAVGMVQMALERRPPQPERSDRVRAAPGASGLRASQGRGTPGRRTETATLSPLKTNPAGSAARRLFENLKNPYFIGDDPALTQTLGWVDAWSTQPSAYAVAARKRTSRAP
jgi:hypothetical protein